MSKESEVQGAALLGSRFNSALLFASNAHRTQVRKGRMKSPYLGHPLRVAGIALDYSADEDTAIAALLHDVVEDCGGMRMAEVIRQEFGGFVADVVLELSDSVLEKGAAKAPWRERKEAYVRHLINASDPAILIVACDKIDNMRSLTRMLVAFEDVDIVRQFKTGPQDQLWYYREILSNLKSRLQPTVQEYERQMNELFSVWK